MESIQRTELLDFPPGIIQKVRKLYGLDQCGTMDEAIDILQDWIRKQSHFTETNFSKSYLERTIITCKGSVERSKLRIDKMCTMRTLMPTFFDKHDVRKEIPDAIKFGQVAIMPKLLDDFYRVFLIKCEDVPDSFDYKDIYRYAICITEYLRNHDYCDGMVAILDYSDVNLVRLLQQINLLDFRQLITILMEGYGMRLKGVHIISSSKVIETFVSILKQLVSAKIGDRLISHKSVDTLYDYIPREVLPEEYGGKCSTIRQLNYKLAETVCSKEHIQYLKKMSKYKTNESYRSSDKFNDQYIGVAGTFRTLHID